MGATTIFRRRASLQKNRSGQERWEVSPPYPTDISQDARFLLYQQSTNRGYDLGVIPLTGDRKPTPFFSGTSNEVQGRFSPNGRWIAYASDESGKFEVYVRPFPTQPSAQSTTISIAGGMQPEWRARRQRALLHSGWQHAHGGAGGHRPGGLHCRHAARAL